MKSLVFLFALLLTAVTLQAQSRHGSHKSKRADVTYACPMHPDIVGKKGDKCSECHMKLTKKAKPAMCCCPMHQECTGKIGDKCPKCGMQMEQPVQPYSCPMHPDQKGVKGGHCPKCHMDLTPAKPEKGNG